MDYKRAGEAVQVLATCTHKEKLLIQHVARFVRKSIEAQGPVEINNHNYSASGFKKLVELAGHAVIPGKPGRGGYPKRIWANGTEIMKGG